jgi:DNA-binding MarR family transcriptional regulator
MPKQQGDPPSPDQIYQLIVQIRGAFHDCAEFTDKLHADLGITAAMRAVMEHVSDHGPQSVPNIARAKKVTRQHIQQLADPLVAAGLAEWQDNPQHKRSKLLNLTSEGIRQFAKIRQREALALDKLSRLLAGVDVEQASTTIRRIRGELDTL